MNHDKAPAHDACAWVFRQKQNCNHVSTTILTRLGCSWLFPLPKTEDSDERKMFCVDWGDKRKIETLAVDDTKKRVSEMFRGLEKRWCQWIISEGGYFEGDKIDIDKIENWKKWK